jgi:hypothetical protein
MSAALLILPAVLLITACGSSSTNTNTSTSTNAAAAASTAPGTAPGGRFSAFRECLAKSGIKLPPRKPGSGGGLLGGGKLPPGVSRSAYQAAVIKCAGLRPRRTLGGPQFKAQLTKFVACMRASGVNLPTPNTTGTGPVFNTKGLDTRSPTFLAAARKCQASLHPSTGAGSGPPTG